MLYDFASRQTPRAVLKLSGEKEPVQTHTGRCLIFLYRASRDNDCLTNKLCLLGSGFARLNDMLAYCRRGTLKKGIILLPLWQPISTGLNPAAYDITEPEAFALLQEENIWADDLEDPLNAAVLYGVNPTPSKRERLQ